MVHAGWTRTKNCTLGVAAEAAVAPVRRRGVSSGPSLDGEMPGTHAALSPPAAGGPHPLLLPRNHRGSPYVFVLWCRAGIPWPPYPPRTVAANQNPVDVLMEHGILRPVLGYPSPLCDLTDML